ncbi:SH3 domain-containing protein [Patescibacteria group bacterium]|nr:SH3 domain-containing protein [Patescibacteria group bacterium]
MKNFSVLLLLILLTPMIVSPKIAHAGDCFEDPIYDRTWSGQITTGAFVRDVACMDGSVVKTTLPVGTQINITGETDGWYRIETSSGLTGWVGQWLIGVTDTNSYQTFTQTQAQSQTQTQTQNQIQERVRGYILLQVEEHGEAWYVDPISDARYYMKDGPTAYEMMRKFGLGISNADLAKLQAGDATLQNRLRGRILLQVQEHGEAYYVHPETGTPHYMADGDAAYSLMRFYSLGISNDDLESVPSEEFEALDY